MISIASSNERNYLRPASDMTAKTTLTRVDALPATGASASQPPEPTTGIAVSQLKQVFAGAPIQASQAIMDQIATMWLSMQDAAATSANAPKTAAQDIYATVKLNNQVVATLYNDGTSAMTNAAGAAVGDLQDPPGLGGPNLAQWRADAYAKLLGGKVEKASTAITQSEWIPRPALVPPSYTRAELDQALAAMRAGSRQNAATSYATQGQMPSSNTVATA